MKHIKTASLVVAACLTLGIATLATADGNGIGRGNGAPGTPGSPSVIGSFRGAETATRALLAALHTRLAITAAQETAWQAFATATLAEAADVDTQNAQAGATITNAMDALNFRATALQRQATDATAVAKAFSTLYGLLTAAQKAIVDQYFAHGGMM